MAVRRRSCGLSLPLIPPNSAQRFTMSSADCTASGFSVSKVRLLRLGWEANASGESDRVR